MPVAWEVVLNLFILCVEIPVVWAPGMFEFAVLESLFCCSTSDQSVAVCHYPHLCTALPLQGLSSASHCNKQTLQTRDILNESVHCSIMKWCEP